MNSNEIKSVVEFQIRRNVTKLYKELLKLLDELHAENCISDEYKAKKRSHILGLGNDSIRELQSLLEKFDIKLKK